MKYWEKYRPFMSEWAIKRMELYDDMYEEYEKREQMERMKKEIYDAVMDKVRVNINNDASPEIERIKNELHNLFK